MRYQKGAISLAVIFVVVAVVYLLDRNVVLRFSEPPRTAALVQVDQGGSAAEKAVEPH